MKNPAVCVLAAALICMSLPLSGCAACSRESFPSESAPLPESIPEHLPDFDQSDPSDSEPEDEPFVEEDPEELPALSMNADFLEIEKMDSESVLWGPGTFKDDKNRSTACIDLQEKYGQYNAYFIGPEDSDTVTLTFDQGYENGYTAPILDALKEKNAKAVFFLTGHYVRTQPELVQRMIDEGHILGSHSDSHKVYCKDLSIEESFNDAKWMQDYLRDNFGYEMRLFRFPEGVFSPQSLALMQQMGYQSIFWSFAYADWNVDNQPEPAAAIEKITDFIHPGEIMLLHSVSKTNAEILPQVIDIIREKGLEIAPFEGMAFDPVLTERLSSAQSDKQS